MDTVATDGEPRTGRETHGDPDGAVPGRVIGARLEDRVAASVPLDPVVTVTQRIVGAVRAGDYHRLYNGRA